VTTTPVVVPGTLSHQGRVDRRRQEHLVKLGRKVSFATRPYGLFPRSPDLRSVEHDLVVGAAGRRCEHQLAAQRAGDPISA
jgi:hypothetical protein